MIEIKFFQNGDETGTLFTEEFGTWELAEDFKKNHEGSIEIFSEKEIG